MPDIQLYPGDNSRFACPECGHFLPVDSWTKCEKCGAHLSIDVTVEASGMDL